MAEFRFPHKLIRLLRATLTGVVNCVKVEGSLSRPFDSKIELRQDDGLSTMLFNIALESIVRAVSDAYSKLEREAHLMVCPSKRTQDS